MSLMLNPLAVPSQMVLTPSGQDGIPWHLEEELRMYGAQLIQHAGSLLELPQVAMATAQVLFQRLWFVTSLKYFSVRSICMGALFLSSKLEETPLGLRNLINVFDFLIQRAEHASSLSPSSRAQELDLPRIDEAVRRQKERRDKGDTAPEAKEFKYRPHSYHTAAFHDTKDALVIAEMQLLKRLGFQTETQLPYAVMVNYLQLLGWSDRKMWVGEEREDGEEEPQQEDEAASLIKGISRRARKASKGKGRGVAQVAWGFLNDSLQTPLPALFPPHVLATASIYLCTLLDPSLPALPTPRHRAKGKGGREEESFSNGHTTSGEKANGNGSNADLDAAANDTEMTEREADQGSEEDKAGKKEVEEEEPDQQAWYHLFDVTRSELRIVCAWILRLYSTAGSVTGSNLETGAGGKTKSSSTVTEEGKGLAARVREEHGGMVEFLDKERVRRWLEVRARRAEERERARESESC